MTKLAEQSRELGRIADWLGRDGGSAINADAEGERELMRRGWEVKSGTLFARASDETLVPMYPHASLFRRGDSEFKRRAFVTLQPSYREAFARFVTLTVQLQSESKAMRQLDGWEQKALSEGIDTAGGFAAPADFMTEVYARVTAVATVRPFATIVPCAGESLRIPAASAAAANAGGMSSGADSVFSSGFIGTWAAEIPAFSDTDPVLGVVTIPIRKLRTATRLSTDLAGDSGVDIFAWLARNGGANLAAVEDLGFLNGDGTALRVSGILASGASTTNVAGTTANTISNTAANVGSAPKIKTLAYSLPSQYAARARWIALRATEGNIRGLIDAQSHFLFDEEEDGSLLAKPFDDTPFVPPDGVAGNKCLVFYDPSSYVIAQRSEISVNVLRERFRDADQIGFILRERVGGVVWDVDAVRLGVV